MLEPNTFKRNVSLSRTGSAASAALLMLLLAGCGGGGSSSSPAPTPQMSGTLSAPGGALAFNAPTGLKRMFAELFGRNAIAALPGTAAVSGATVKLIEIDSSGNQVGADIATALTAADGSFTFNLPADFTPGPRFVVRAVGTTSNLERLVTDLTSQDVDPASHATRSLVLTHVQAASGNIQNLQPSQVEELANQVADLVDDIDSGSFTTSTVLLSAMTTEAQNDEELGFALGNLVAAGGIAGTVTDASGAPLANIKVVARDFNQWVTRAQTRTDANGQYTLKLGAGDYIVGAVNFTATSMGASEWWTCNDTAGAICGAANMFGAGKVTVGASGAVPVDFKLEAGARVEGTITASGTTMPLRGVHFMVRDFLSDQPIAKRRARSDGTYRINLRPGTYTLGTRNRTRLPYAGGLYNGPASGGTATASGGANSSDATVMALTAGTATPVNFELSEGGALRGIVTDGTNPVAGIPVRFYDSTDQHVESERTNLLGRYRLWVRPGTYELRSRGQIANRTVVAYGTNNNPAAVDFTAPMGRATASMRDSAGNPMAQVKVRLYETLTGNTDLQGFEISNSDGSVDLYAPTGNFLVEYKVDNGSITTGSAIHDGTASPTGKRLSVGTVVAFDSAVATPVSLGTMTLPSGGELKGTVTVGSANTPTGNIVVQVRFGGTGGGARFVNTRTQKDGSYSISIPAATYPRVCAFVPGTSGACGATLIAAGQYAGVNNVVVTASVSNTLNIAIP